jgi:hypothetical protein
MLSYIGPFGQPTTSLADWKSNGCNLAVICPEGSVKADWRARCRQLGLVYIDTPSLDLKADAADPSLIGWALPDEPRSLRGSKRGMEVAPYRALCAALRAAHPHKLLWGTFAGTDLTAAFPWYHGQDDIPYFGPDGSVDSLTDIACDWYPGNRGYAEDLLIRQLDLVHSWTNNTRSYTAILECSDQNLPLGAGKVKRVPTRESILDQAKRVVEWGVDKLIWFPQRIGKNFESFDGRDTAQKAACKEVSVLYPPSPAVAQPPVDDTKERILELEFQTSKFQAVLDGIASLIKGTPNA